MYAWSTFNASSTQGRHLNEFEAAQWPQKD